MSANAPPLLVSQRVVRLCLFLVAAIAMFGGALQMYLGQPDTTELFDMLAHAADKSTGTFGFLMRKLQKEVQKAR